MKADVVDVIEWAELGARLSKAGPAKYAEVLDAIRQITEAQEVIARFDGQLLFGERPSKRYAA